MNFFLGRIIPLHALFYKKRKPWNLRTEDLIQYPAGSLGNKLGNFLRDEQLQPIPRIERHDAFHLLFDFTTQIQDEVAIQYFLIGNGKISPFPIITSIFAALILPEWWDYFIQQFRKGMKARNIANWNFKELLHDDFNDLKKIVNHQPVHNEALLRKLAEFDAAAH